MSSRVPAAVLVALAAGVALSAGPAAAQGPVAFTARVDRNTTELGDPIVCEVTLTLPDGRAEGYKAPDFRGFRVLGEYPSQSTQIQMGGGSSVMRTVYTWRYELSPSESGRQVIGPARVRVRGKELRTAPVTVTVAAGDIRPPGAATADPQRNRSRPPQRRVPQRYRSPFDDLFGGAADPDPQQAPITIPGQSQGPRGGDSFLQVVADKRKVVAGEQVLVEWYLNVPDQPDHYEPVVEPRMDGFWSEDLLGNPRKFNATQRTHNGRIYLAFLVMRKALFPLQSGTLTITPLESDVGQADFFGRVVRKQRLKAEPLTIEVEPLPAAGKPDGFDPAAVGKLALAARLDRQQVAVGEAVTVTLTISGQSNLRKLAPPKLPALDGFRSYDPKVDVKLDTSNGVSGQKTVEYLLLPERPGTAIVPAIELAYFDPTTRRYEQARTDPLRIVVTGDAGKGADPGRPAAVAGGGLQNVLAAEIRPPRSRGELSRDLGTTLYRSPGFFWAVLLPPVAFAVTGLVDRLRRRRGQDTEGSRRREARKLVRRHLRAAEGKLDGDAAAFYVEIDRVLSGALSARLGQPVAGLSRDELAAALERSGLAASVVQGSLAALEECDQARFAPGSGGAGQRRAVLARAEELLAAIEKPAGGRAG